MTEFFDHTGHGLPHYSPDFYTDILQPCMDDDFLIQRLDGGNRWLRKHPETVEYICYTLARDDDESIMDAVDVIRGARYHSTPPNELPINRLLSFMTFTKA